MSTMGWTRSAAFRSSMAAPMMAMHFGGDMTPEEATRRTAAFLRGVII